MSGAASHFPLLPWQQAQFRRLHALWSNARMPHAWLLSGVAGVGKLAFIRHFANVMLCRHTMQGQPCGRCQDCHLLQSGTHPDWLLLQPEGRQLKIEQIRDAIEFAQNTSQRGGAKVIVLQPAEAMNLNAANALLKMLEEPPPSTFFFLLSEQPGLLLATLRSRCQLLEFPVPGEAEAKQWLQSRAPAAADADLYLTLAQGAPLHALALAEQGAAQGFQLQVQVLQAVLGGRSTPVQAAKKCEELGLRASLDYQMLSLAALLRHLQAGEPVQLAALQPLQALCQEKKGLALLRRLHTLQQRLLAARKVAMATNNANPLLMLEALLAEWGTVLGMSVTR